MSDPTSGTPRVLNTEGLMNKIAAQKDEIKRLRTGGQASVDSLRSALAAKDAEIERLRKGNDAMKRMLASIAPEQIPGPFICGAVGDPGDDGLHDGYLICPTYGADWAATYRREAPEPRQDRRSGVSAHGEPPDTPTGDTRG